MTLSKPRDLRVTPPNYCFADNWEVVGDKLFPKSKMDNMDVENIEIRIVCSFITL